MQNEALAYFSRRGRPIVAASSALGGPVAVIRISGEQLDFLQPLIGKLPAPNAFKYASIRASQKSKNGIHEIDRALVLYFQAPHSFTGENVVEIQGHGVPTLVEEIIDSVVLEGGERALPGEFSFRAVMNDKMELGDAERLQTALSTDSLSSEWASKLLNVSKSASPELVARFHDCLRDIQSARGRIEAAIDFPEAETEQAADIGAAREKLRTVIASFHRFLSSYHQFCRSAGEARVVIVGEPNVGKSSLLNALVGGARALVSPTAGTTRDVVETRLRGPRGQWFRLLDTAGIRNVEGWSDHESLEKAGIEMGLESVQLAQVVVSVKSLLQPEGGLSHDYLRTKMSPGATLLELYSFADQVSHAPIKSFNFSKLDKNSITQILQLIESSLEVSLQSSHGTEMELVISRRQGQLLEKALEEVVRGLQCLDGALPIELAGDSLRSAEGYIKGCIGEGLGDEYIGQIFSQFCLGK